MQPFRSVSKFLSPAVYVVLASLMIAGGRYITVQNQTLGIASQKTVTVSSNEDDRGSGRLANQSNCLEPLSFRGSGRIHPDPQPATEAAQVDSTPYYRGSGRLS